MKSGLIRLVYVLSLIATFVLLTSANGIPAMLFSTILPYCVSKVLVGVIKGD